MKIKLYKLRQLAFISLFSFTLLSCASAPTDIQLTPKIAAKTASEQSTQKSKQNWTVSSQDLRVALYLIDINSGDGVATLINESSSSRLLIEKILKDHWVKNGIKMNPDIQTDHNIEIQLVKLLSISKEETFSHETTSNIIIKVHLTSEAKSFTKTFRSKSFKEGAMSASVDEINKNLSAQLSKLLTQIVSDSELSNTLKTF